MRKRQERRKAAGLAAAAVILIIVWASGAEGFAQEPERQEVPGNYYSDYLVDDVTKQAQLLKGIHLFSGTEKGFELERPMNRCEAAVMLVKFMGEQETALMGTWSHPFRDVPAWAGPYVGWLYDQKITSGVSGDCYGADQPTTLWQYAAFLSRALHGNGEIDPGIAAEYEIQDRGEETLLRGDAVNLSCRALFCSYDRDLGAEKSEAAEESKKPDAVEADTKTTVEYLCEKGVFTMEELRESGWNVIRGRADILGFSGNTDILYNGGGYLLIQRYEGRETEISTVKTDTLEPISSYRVRDEEAQDLPQNKYVLQIRENKWIEGFYNGGGGLYQLDATKGVLTQITAHAAWDVRFVKDGSWLLISGPGRYPMGDPYSVGDRVSLLDKSGKITEIFRMENSLLAFAHNGDEPDGEETALEVIYPLRIVEHIRGYGMLNYDDAYYDLMESGGLEVVDFRPGSSESAMERGVEWVETRLREKGLLNKE